MRHPFELKNIEIDTIESDVIRELTDEETRQISGGGKADFTTLALGEEGGGCPTVPPIATTRALGEEGGGYPIEIEPPVATTLALGEEGGDFNY